MRFVLGKFNLQLLGVRASFIFRIAILGWILSRSTTTSFQARGMFRLFSLDNVLTVLTMILSLLCCSPMLLMHCLRSGRPFAHRRPCGAESKSTRCAQVQGFNLCYRCSLPAEQGFSQTIRTKWWFILIYIINWIWCAGRVQEIFVWAEPVSLFGLSGLTMSAGTTVGMRPHRCHPVDHEQVLVSEMRTLAIRRGECGVLAFCIL